jgi:long-chain acyl-CoA synthetase
VTPVISALTFSAAQKFGDKSAVTVVDGNTLTFMEIDRHAACLAGGLARIGIGRGDGVILHLPNGWEWVVAYHAIARLGAVVVPVNILQTTAELAFIAADSAARAAFVPADRVAAIADSAGVPSLKLIALGATAADAVSFGQLLDSSPCEPVSVSPEDLWTIAYTSGTSGRPKGAMLAHRAVFESAMMTATIHVRHRSDRVLTALPFAHVYGNIVLNAAFLAGCHIVAMQRFDAGAAIELIARERITLFEGVPTMYYQMLALPGTAAADFTNLTRCTVGGQTMPIEKIDEIVRRFGCPLLELWGMTELAGPAATHAMYWPPRHGSVGRMFPNMEARVADLNDSSKTAPNGTPGELTVRGPLVMRGYWNNPEATAEALSADGWLKTGDIAVTDEEGYLSIIDRRKDMIVTAGYKVYPAELERVVALHPAVSMTAVIPVKDLEKGEIAKAVVVLKPGGVCTTEELAAHCRQHLAAYKVPRLIVFADDLPKTSTGKILRRALRNDAADKRGVP